MVRRADAFVRGGKLDQAVAEYRALVDENPGDSGAANALGDLYARLGDTPRAIEQYTRLGESEWLQGFSAKAAAFYKKALKVDANCEGALARLGEIAASQSLFVDAARHWNRLLERRRTRGDAAGEAEVNAWLADLKSASAAPRRATSVGMTPRVEPPAAAEPVPADATPAQAVETPAAPPSDTGWQTAPAAAPTTDAATPDPAPQDAPSATPVTTEDIPLVVEQFGQLSQEPASVPPSANGQADWTALTPAPDADWFTANGTPVDVEPEPVGEPAPLAQPDHAEPEAAALVSDAVEPAHAVRDDWEIVIDVSDEIDMATAFVPAEEPVVRESPEPAEVLVRDEMPALAERYVAAPAVEIRDERCDDDGADSSLIADLVVAAETPTLRFQAGVQLGRIFLQRGDLGRGIEWLERACDVTPPVRDHGLQARYDLADALERAGCHARALDVLSDLDLDAGSYRDVPARITRLSRAVAT